MSYCAPPPPPPFPIGELAIKNGALRTCHFPVGTLKKEGVTFSLEGEIVL